MAYYVVRFGLRTVGSQGYVINNISNKVLMYCLKTLLFTPYFVELSNIRHIDCDDRYIIVRFVII